MNTRTHINITVLGEPCGQPRHRTTRAGHIYTPAGTKRDPKKFSRWREAIAAGVAIEMRKCGVSFPVSGPVSVSWSAIFQRPKRMQSKRFPAGLIPHTIKPDMDNIDKLICDAITRAGLWRDDCQRQLSNCDKCWSGDWITPGVRIVIGFEAGAA